VSPARYEYRETGRARETLRTLLVMAAAVTVLAVLAIGGWQLAKNAGAPKRRMVQQISIVKPPLPPKPPPEPEKPKPEVKEQIKQPEPEPKEAAPAPQQDLGLDAKGAGGGDSFGLVGRPGGRDITTIGSEVGKGSGGRLSTAFYASQLQSEIQEELNQDDQLRSAEYRALVELWLSPQGKVTRVKLAGSTGDAELDRRLREALAESKRLRPPPEGVALPIRVELVARR
jgi:protein TonB